MTSKKTDAAPSGKAGSGEPANGFCELAEEDLAQVAGGADMSPYWNCDCGCRNIDYSEQRCPDCGQPQPSISCVLAGTMVSMADGTKKPVEDIRAGDMVRSWDFEKGAFVDAEILHPFHLEEGAKAATVIEALFSDGTKVSIANAHGFFDLTLGRYVELDRDAAQFIGHDFAREDGAGWKGVRLQEVSVREEAVEAYAPVAKGTLNCVTDGMLSIPGYCSMLYNPFDVDVSTLTWKNMESDIEEYGLLPYERTRHLCSRPVYDAFNAGLFGISFGKGNCNMEELEKVVGVISADLRKLEESI